MDLNIIALVLSIVTIIILLVMIRINNKKINELIKVQQDLLEKSSSSLDENKIVAEIVEKISLSSSSIKEESEDNIEKLSVEVEIPKVEQKPMQIPTLDEGETAALLSAFSKEDNADTSFHTQDLGDLAREIKESEMNKLPKYEEVEKVLETPELDLAKIKAGFDRRLLEIKKEIDQLATLSDGVVREQRKIELKEELVLLKAEILKFQSKDK